MSGTVGLILGYWFFSARHWFALDLGREVGDSNGGGGSGVGMSEKMPSTISSMESRQGSGVGVGAGARVGGGGLCGISRPGGPSATSTGLDDSAIECDDTDLDELEHWLDLLERDLRSLA